MNYKTTIYGIGHDSYYIHQIVKNLFPQGNVRFIVQDNYCVVYSENKVQEACFDGNVSIGSCEEFNIEDLLKTTVKMFTLQFNPVLRDRKTQKVSPYPEDGLKEYAIKRFAEIGITLKQMAVKNKGWDVFDKVSGNQISIYYYEIMGVCEISDKDLFKKNFFNGIGQAKSFGYGLINLI